MTHVRSKYLKVTDDKHSTYDIDTPLPFWRKLCFAVGGAPYQITSNVIGFFLSLFLLEVALMKPRYVSIILFSGKAWDAITDPTIGILAQRTDTRCGKMRPWILLSAPFACASYFLLFYVPFDITKDGNGKDTVDANDDAKLAFYFCMFCLFQGFVSCLHVPYTAMTMYVATRQSDRDSITAIRMIFEALGVLIAVVVQGTFVSDTRCKGDEKQDHNITLTAERDAYVHGSTVVVVIYMICCIICFFGSKEKKGIVQQKKSNQMGFFSGIKLVFTFKPYVWASLTFLLFSIAIQIVQGNIALYCTHSLKMGQDFSLLVFVLLVVAIVSMPLWQCFSNRFGKKKAYAAGMILMVPVLISQLYLPTGIKWLYYIIMAWSGLGISVALLLPWSVLPDVIDLYMLEYNDRHDALFYSFYVFFNKLAVGIALAVSQLALEFGGYESGVCSQPESVDQTLRYLITPGPTVMILLALLCLYNYPIDEEMRTSIRQRLRKIGEDNKEVIVEQLDSSRSYESIKHNYETSEDTMI